MASLLCRFWTSRFPSSPPREGQKAIQSRRQPTRIAVGAGSHDYSLRNHLCRPMIRSSISSSEVKYLEGLIEKWEKAVFSLHACMTR